jgi:hypothetical protein
MTGRSKPADSSRDASDGAVESVDTAARTDTSGADARAPGPQLRSAGWAPPPLPWIVTPTLARYLAQLTLAVNDNSISALDGPPGLGKTALSREMHRRVIASGRPSTWVHLPERASEKDLYVQLITAVQGHCQDRAARLLRAHLVELLTGSERVLLLDEAHRVGTDGLQWLRHLWDRGDRTWAMVLSGQTVRAALAGAAELADRVPLVLEFAPMTGGDVLAAVHQFGPLFAGAPDDVVAAVDRAYCHGRWRPWHDVRHRALTLAEQLEACTLDRRLASNVLSTWGRTL